MKGFRWGQLRKLGGQSARLFLLSSELGPPTMHSLAGEGVGSPNTDEGTDIVAVGVNKYLRPIVTSKEVLPSPPLQHTCVTNKYVHIVQKRNNPPDYEAFIQHEFEDEKKTNVKKEETPPG